MEELYKLGISEETVNSMCEINPEIKEMTPDEITSKVKILKQINCDDTMITNIIGSNALFLSRTDEEITKLLYFLNRLGFTTLNILLDSNPYILNLEIFEIEEYINKRKENNDTLESIIDDLDSNPYLFSEM